METAAEAREPPSLVIHLLEKEWSIRPGRNQNTNGPGARRFSYGQPISVHSPHSYGSCSITYPAYRSYS